MLDKLGKNIGKYLTGILTAMFLFCTIFVTSPVTATAKEIKLKYSIGYMPFEPPAIQGNHTLEAIEKKTGGKVTFERFMGGALGEVAEQLDLVSSGAVDVISCHIDQYPQSLPLHTMLNSEQLVSGGQILANLDKIRNQIPETKAILDAEQKKNNIKMLACYIQGISGITTRFPAKSLADMKGKKVNVISPFQRKVLNEFGWIPVNVQVPELYEALSRGLIDAIFMATAAVQPLKWYEVGKFHLTFTDNQVASQPLTVNLDVWNSLPPDIRKVFEESAKETAQWSIEADKMNAKAAYDSFEKAGVPIIKLSDEDNIMFFETYFGFANNHNLENAKKLGVEKQARIILKYLDGMRWGKYRK